MTDPQPEPQPWWGSDELPPFARPAARLHALADELMSTPTVPDAIPTVFAVVEKLRALAAEVSR
jgi:hypothetical protein